MKKKMPGTERRERSGAARLEEHGLPTTPDGRYFVVRGRLWRCTNPALTEEVRGCLVQQLMSARRAKGAAMRAGDSLGVKDARKAVDEAKHLLGERGAVWWTDGAPDLNRHMAKNTMYAGWLAEIAKK